MNTQQFVRVNKDLVNLSRIESIRAIPEFSGGLHVRLIDHEAPTTVLAYEAIMQLKCDLGEPYTSRLEIMLADALIEAQQRQATRSREHVERMRKIAELPPLGRPVKVEALALGLPDDYEDGTTPEPRTFGEVPHPADYAESFADALSFADANESA